MTPTEFIEKWRASTLNERQGAIPHFEDLCALIGAPKPYADDASADEYTFEKATAKQSGGVGHADVWKKNCFAWEYKAKGRNLDEALRQLKNYAGSLGNPPLLIVSDMERIRVHTNWNHLVTEVHDIALDDLMDGAKRDFLLHAFTDPDRLKPRKSRQALTEEAAEKFVRLAQRLRERGNDAEATAHFVNRIVFCMFAEDVNLLPNKMFQRMLELSLPDPAEFQDNASQLFAAMRSGGKLGLEKVEWFNGGLFDSDDALALEKGDIAELLMTARLDWSDIDPSILGTLFERGLDPDKRSQLGAHYTDRDKIMMIVNPVIVEPLQAEWEEVKAKIAAQLTEEKVARKRASETKAAAKSGAETRRANSAQAKARKLHEDFLEHLRAFRVLDPACGSGNFLNLSLLALKDIEHQVNQEAEALGLPRQFPGVGPEAVKGIEINPFAAELARVSVWIAEIQWMRRNGFEAARNPILRPMETIECRDALLNEDGTRAEWPDADVVVGNPPFLGDRKMKPELGDEYVNALREAFVDEVRGGADLVCFWFANAWLQTQTDKLLRVGLVTTNSIRGGANREVLKPIVEKGSIFSAWNDESWTVEGAAVRVSLVCFSANWLGPCRLDGRTVDRVLSDLTEASGAVDITTSKKLSQNANMGFQGTISYGPFEIDGELARSFLSEPSNVDGSKNSEVVRPWTNGRDITRRSEDRWLIYFPLDSDEEVASLFEAPFEYVAQTVKPYRLAKDNLALHRNWWRLWRGRPELFRALGEVERQIVTPRVSKHRLFVWRKREVVVDSAAVSIARDDDTAFGILHSRFHEHWSLRMGTWLGKGNDPRYTPSTTFETFPFPEGLTPNIPAADYADDPRAQKIAEAAAKLNELRENWLNPPELIKRVPEVVEGYPDRLLPIDDAAEKVLKKRTLTNLYNARPAWLDHAHAALDEAVAEAYGWGDDWRAGKLDEDEILARLFRLNQERAAAQDT